MRGFNRSFGGNGRNKTGSITPKGFRTRPVFYNRGVSGKQSAYRYPQHEPGKPLLLLVMDSNGRNIVRPEIVNPSLNASFELAAISIPGGKTLHACTELRHLPKCHHKVSYVVLALGTNDMFDGMAVVRQFRTRVENLISVAESVYPDAELSYATIIPRHDEFESVVPEANKIISEITTDYGIPLIKIKVPSRPEYWSDLIHMSDEGLRQFMRSFESEVESKIFNNNDFVAKKPTTSTYRRHSSVFDRIGDRFSRKRRSPDNNIASHGGKRLSLTTNSTVNDDFNRTWPRSGCPDSADRNESTSRNFNNSFRTNLKSSDHENSYDNKFKNSQRNSTNREISYARKLNISQPRKRYDSSSSSSSSSSNSNSRRLKESHDSRSRSPKRNVSQSRKRHDSSRSSSRSPRRNITRRRRSSSSETSCMSKRNMSKYRRSKRSDSSSSCSESDSDLSSYSSSSSGVKGHSSKHSTKQSSNKSIRRRNIEKKRSREYDGSKPSASTREKQLIVKSRINKILSNDLGNESSKPSKNQNSKPVSKYRAIVDNSSESCHKMKKNSPKHSLVDFPGRFSGPSERIFSNSSETHDDERKITDASEISLLSHNKDKRNKSSNVITIIGEASDSSLFHQKGNLTKSAKNDSSKSNRHDSAKRVKNKSVKIRDRKKSSKEQSHSPMEFVPIESKSLPTSIDETRKVVQNSSCSKKRKSLVNINHNSHGASDSDSNHHSTPMKARRVIVPGKSLWTEIRQKNDSSFNDSVEMNNSNLSDTREFVCTTSCGHGSVKTSARHVISSSDTINRKIKVSESNSPNNLDDDVTINRRVVSSNRAAVLDSKSSSSRTKTKSSTERQQRTKLLGLPDNFIKNVLGSHLRKATLPDK